MKIAIGCDHGGIVLKDAVLAELKGRGIEVKDMGCFDSSSVDYPDFALAVAEEVMTSVFTTFSDKKVTPAPFPRITYSQAMLEYGTDKPDLRNPLKIIVISPMFVHRDVAPFRGRTVRAEALRRVRLPFCIHFFQHPAGQRPVDACVQFFHGVGGEAFFLLLIHFLIII